MTIHLFSIAFNNPIIPNSPFMSSSSPNLKITSPYRLFFSTALCLLCDFPLSNYACADVAEMTSKPEQHDSLITTTKKDMGPENLKLSTKDLNVLAIPDTAIDDFDQITKKIFTKRNQGYTDTLEGAMISAYETNPEIKIQRATLRGADEGVVQAKAGWRPTINGTLTGTLSQNEANSSANRNGKTDHTSKSKHAQQQAQIQINQNLFQGGNTVYSTRASVAQVKSMRAALKDKEQEILLNSVTVYFALLAQYATLEYLLQNEDAQKKAFDQNKGHYEVGAVDRTTVAQAEYAYTDAIVQRVQAEGQLDSLKANYEKVINRKPGNLTVPKIPTIPDSLEKVLEQVQLNNSKIIQCQYDEQVARHNIDVNQSALLPTIGLQAKSTAQLDRNNDSKNGYQSIDGKKRYSRDTNVNHQVQIEMTVPLYEGGTTRSKVRQAAEAATEARIKIEATRRDVIDNASKSWFDLTAAKLNRDVLKNQMKAAEVSVQGVRHEVVAGGRTYLDVVTEITKLVNSQRAYVDAEKTYRLAAFQVLYWMGALSPKSQNLPVEVYDPKAHYNEVKNKF